MKPRRASDLMRIALVLLVRCFAWREALTIVQPATLVRWHRQAFRLLWRWRSRGGRSRLPIALRHLIRGMARDNPTWGEERIAAELLVAVTATFRVLSVFVALEVGSRRLVHVHVTSEMFGLTSRGSVVRYHLRPPLGLETTKPRSLTLRGFVLKKGFG